MTEKSLQSAWVDLPSAERIVAAAGGQQLPYQKLTGSTTVGNMSRLLAAHPRIGKAFRALGHEVMWAPGQLSRPEREMVAAVTAAAQDCAYWTQSHAEFLRAEHGNGALIAALKARQPWTSAVGLSERERALCTVAHKMSATPTRMTEEDWQPLRELGFDDEGILEVAHIVGYFNYLTRLADGLGLALDMPEG